MLLDDLEDVDWARIMMVNTPAVEMPCWIVGITSADAEIRSGAFDRLSMDILHQGDVTEASSHVVPFLLRLLPNLETELKIRTLDLLSGLAVTIEAEESRNQMPDDLKAQYTWIDYGKASQAQRVLEEKTYAATRAGIPIIQPLVDHENQRVADAARRLLARLT